MPLFLDKMRHHSTLVIAEHDTYDPLPHFEEFVRSLRDHFPLPPKQVPAPASAPSNVPRFILRSKNSQLFFFPERLQFQVEYFGNFESDPRLGSEYCRRKVSAALALLQSGAHVAGSSFLGVVHSFHISAGGLGFDPTTEIANAFLSPPVLTNLANPFDFEVRAGVAWRDKYFLNYTFKNYRSIVTEVELSASPSDKTAKLSMSKPGLVDQGIEIMVDVNTKLQAQGTATSLVFALQDFDDLVDSALEAAVSDLHARFGMVG